jgi:hypothetical protein
MNVDTDAEVVRILTDSRWNSGINVDKDELLDLKAFLLPCFVFDGTRT